ncbi:MAG: helix-turn-helix transcriptional regulator [Bacteroidetes bacterium]|nr:helix-turn-helix transcriptional regulator [Bacteroidota bacterium]
MATEKEEQSFIRFADKVGYDIGESMARNIVGLYQRTFDFLPEMAVFAASYIVKRTFTRHTTPPRHIKNSIRFFFHNVFEYNEAGNSKESQKVKIVSPYVRVFPSALPHSSLFKKDTHVNVVSIFVSADYLKSFLGTDGHRFRFLFESDNNFLIEEIMSDDLIRTVNDIVKKEPPDTLKDYHYRLKVLELLFYLFQRLAKREQSAHQKLSGKDIKAIYQVRDKLISSLEKPTSITVLKKIAGMNELKMRQVFIQVFGMGIYEYYQQVRMKEAARLLREEKLSVSEAGYKMGFENLSHFSRVFEKHIGSKPKKYSMGYI